MKRWKIIAIISAGTIGVASFYFFYWRKRRGVSAADAIELGKFKVVEAAPNTTDTPTNSQMWEVE